MYDRREFLRLSASGLLLAGGAPWASLAAEGTATAQPALPAGAVEAGLLERLPGKLPLIKKSFRPPNFETPLAYFNEAFTPNDAFFVRYHLAGIPEVDAAQWKLAIAGESVERPFELGLDTLKREFETVELAAVCMCSGNRRGLSQPHVPGVQWGQGAIGNAKWRGVRLRDLLSKAGIRKDAVEIVLAGADGPVLDKTPAFVKSLPVWKAMDENTLVAFEMNGERLPHWNGHPARLVVPGWTATYWTKHITSVSAVSQPFKGFWMNPAYRIPKGRFPIIDRFVSQETEANTPITEMVVNSMITSPESGARIRSGKTATIAGVAWEAGYGIAAVEVSEDEGRSWQTARMGADLGRFSWRQWTHRFTPMRTGRHVVLARATNRAGTTQTSELIFNPAGYHNNVIQRIELEATEEAS
ncbi:MAG TPA: molybdopterin-dependent oxidoreductase [Burkholderiales bacterium]|nr:molybdopterin-dependent oxidoreductase [Burkholderiales bacterium]